MILLSIRKNDGLAASGITIALPYEKIVTHEIQNRK
jgi:hypothetical protein